FLKWRGLEKSHEFQVKINTSFNSFSFRSEIHKHYNIISKIERQYGQLDHNSALALAFILDNGFSEVFLYKDKKYEKLNLHIARSNWDDEFIRLIKYVKDSQTYLVFLLDDLYDDQGKNEFSEGIFTQSLLPPDEALRKVGVISSLTGYPMLYNYVSNVIRQFKVKLLGIIGKSDERDYLLFAKILPIIYKRKFKLPKFLIHKRSMIKEINVDKAIDLSLTQGDVVIKLHNEDPEKYLDKVKVNALKCFTLTLNPSRNISFPVIRKDISSDDLLTIVNSIDGEYTFDFLGTHSHFLKVNKGLIVFSPKYRCKHLIFNYTGVYNSQHSNKIATYLGVASGNRTSENLEIPSYLFRQEHILGIIHLMKNGFVELFHVSRSYPHKRVLIRALEEVKLPFEAWVESQAVYTDRWSLI
ncbi:hypothetical protein DJ524_09385, partial [Sulfolobus sp. D5]